MNKFGIFSIFIFIVLLNCKSSSKSPIYQDPNSPIENRVKDLLKRMTLKEKIAQTYSVEGKRLFDENGNMNVEYADSVLKYGIGHLSRSGEENAPEKTVKVVNALQKYLVENTRLGIPAIVHEECLHGLMMKGATIFPQAIALASTWDPDLVEEVFSAVAVETRSRGCSQALTPMVDIARDPRFGRVEESYGEDPYLVSIFAVAVVRGFQGKGPLIHRKHIAATLKHFAASGQPESGMNQGPANYSERIIREVFLPPFRAGVEEARALSIMAAYQEIDGIPCHVNKWLLYEILRNEWDFKGIVVSDYGGIGLCHSLHKISESKEFIAKKALEAGVDIELPNAKYYQFLENQILDGRINESVLDRAVERILRVKFLLGLFDNPYAESDEAEKINHCQEHRELALKAAHKSVVLLKNENNLLPLDTKKIKSIAVIGPNANVVHFGGYSTRSSMGRGVSIYEGIKNKAGKKIRVEYAEGCKIHLGDGYWRSPEIVLNDPEKDRNMIKEAVSVAKKCDVALVVIGGNPQTCRESLQPRLGDRHDLNLIGLQDELVNEIQKTGKPTIVFFINGRPLSINDISRNIPAILEGWYLGEETGTAVADILFGDVNPGGKLPISFPRSVGHLPSYYNKKPSGLHRRYILEKNESLFPFGHGLSYTTFSYSNLSVDPDRIRATEKASVSVDVTNTGQREGDEVVQMYIRDLFSSVTRPVKELKGFQRITIDPGETKRIKFEINFDNLKFYNEKMEEVVEPGYFDIMVGTNSVDLDTVRLEVY